MRSDEYYMKANNEDPFLNILNPDRILYCICIIKKDYMETVGLFNTQTFKILKENRLKKTIYMHVRTENKGNSGSRRKFTALLHISLL